MVSVPRVPGLQVTFALTLAGIAFTVFSRNVRQKRVVLPVTIVLFSVLWLESLRQTVAPPTAVLAVFASMLIVNGIVVYRRIHYCTRCGRTLQDGRRRKVCNQCSAVREDRT